MSDDAALGYRPCVGLIVTKGDGRVFAGRRNDLSPNDPAAWQLPQGGIDEGEETAVLRLVFLFRALQHGAGRAGASRGWWSTATTW